VEVCPRLNIIWVEHHARLRRCAASAHHARHSPSGFRELHIIIIKRWALHHQAL
jgi:hypothetical protein